MPSRSSLPAWCAALSLAVLCGLCSWILGRPTGADAIHAEAATRALGAERLEGPPRPSFSLEAPSASEMQLRAALEQHEPKPRRPRRLGGRVLEQQGNPCEGARVLLYSPDWSMTVDYTFTGHDGTFELRYPFVGEFDVIARSQGVGTCDRTRVALDDALGQQQVELVLNRPDWLAGRLVDGENRPLRDAELWAFPAVFSTASSAWLFQWRMRAESRTLRGEHSGITRTDEQGRFRFVDLEPGAYFIARRERLDPPHDARVPYSTGESTIELVEEHTWLRLRCRGGSGAQAFCAPVARLGPTDSLLEPATDESASTGDVLFEVEPCRVYRCGFIDPQRGCVEEEISMPCRGGTVVRELVLPDPTPGGRLTLEMSAPWRRRDSSARRVRIRSVSSGVLLMVWTQFDSGGADLPAGEFVLEVADPPARGPEIFMRSDPLGEELVTRRRILIRPDADTRVDLLE